MSTHTHNLSTTPTRRHEAAGSCRARTSDRLPGVEWVAAALLVVLLTALVEIDRRELRQSAPSTQQAPQNEYHMPDGFGVNSSHGGEHDPAKPAS